MTRQDIIITMNDARLDAHSQNWEELRDTLRDILAASGFGILNGTFAAVSSVEEFRLAARVAVAVLLDDAGTPSRA